MRLDLFLHRNGYCESREKAKKMIADGRVILDGAVMGKPSFDVGDSHRVEVLPGGHPEYVGRGGEKLMAALRCFRPEVLLKTAVDIGASTGGFTDCLIKNGAKKVYAVDVGRGQLHASLRAEPKVVSLEGRNARDLSPEMLRGDPIDLVVMDVSFISQTLLFPAVKRILKRGGGFISLIKPQFEAGREHVGKNGIVKDERARKLAVERVLCAARESGFLPVGVIDSPILGGGGNHEYLAYFINTDDK